MNITKNKLINNFQNWGKLFNIEFYIKVNKLSSNDWLGVFSFTVDGGDASIPKLWIHHDGYFAIQFGYKNPLTHKSFNIYFELGREYKMVIKQYKESNGIYVYEIMLDDDSKLTWENPGNGKIREIHENGKSRKMEKTRKMGNSRKMGDNPKFIKFAYFFMKLIF